MNLPRLWRTVRHLSAEQWVFRALCRGRRVAMGAAPVFSRRHIARQAARLPLPDLNTAPLAACAATVLALQEAVHGDHLDGIAAAKFVLLNRAYDFNSLEDIPWRGDFHEGNNPLRRMTLAYMGYAVPLLARGQAGDLHIILRLLRGLDAHNPWSAPGVFRDVWNAYTASHRLINLLCGLALYRANGGTREAAAEAEILDHVRFCAAFVRANLERDLQYNHLLKNYVALAVYAAALPELPARFGFLAKEIPTALRQNVLPDGGHAERSPLYHLLSLLDMDLLTASKVLEGEAAAGLDETADRMAVALGVMTHPDCDIALFNDSWLGEAPPAIRVREFLAAEETARLPDTGYVRIGSGGDAGIFDCGPCGPDDNPGHAHADFLSVEASIGHKRFLVDSGVPTYTAGPDRDGSRSAQAHNGPRLEGVEPIEFWKSFRVGRRGRAREIGNPGLAGIAPLWCAGTQDGYAPVGVEARRFVGLWPGAAILVCDAWIGPVRHPARTDLLIPDSWSPDDKGTLAFVQDDVRVEISVLAGRFGGCQPDRYWPRFGLEAPANRVTLVPESFGDFRAVAFWLNWADPAAAPDAATVASLFGRLVGS
ncbi:MAG: alginate lyase family protein [Proteobacteria bacterium]|nr:alginate lyase family protein [Pseudomonadota bacterium]